MLTLFNEFKKSLKDTSVEEIVDLVIFRPIAFVIVKIIYRFPITPNQISFMSLITGISAGFFFAMGTRTSFFYGGLIYALSHILDCCDGMVARLKKNGTFIGRIVDGFTDYVTTTAVFIGINIGIYHAGISYSLEPWIIVASAGGSMIIHCMAVDYFKSEFMAHALDKVNSTREDKEIFKKELAKLKQEKGKYFDKLMIIFYLGYSDIQITNNHAKRHFDAKTYYRKNKLLLRLWTWIGPATHIFVIIISALFFAPEIFFYYSLGIANLLMAFLLIIQVRTNKSILLPAEE